MATKLSDLPCTSTNPDARQLDIVSISDSGNWALAIPVLLRNHQEELETLLSKVFQGRPHSPENVALAQQLSLNWCASKCRQSGLSFEDLLN